MKYKILLIQPENKEINRVRRKQLNNFVQITMPVSYTHLDVYKRQVIRILKKEKPQGIIATLGGQTGLNMAIELDSCGILPKLGIRLLGTQLDSIKLAEDRELFKDLMVKTGQKTTHSTIVTSLEEAEAFSHECDFPLIVRPAYTLGGTGGGTAHNMDELMDITARGLKMSLIHQVLMEQSVAGWKEIEYEVIRDNADNCIIVCNMENICLLYTSRCV